jgi:hypothetical protein
MQHKLARRKRAFADTPIADAPMFCIETAIKAFFWSTVLYDYTEAEGHKFSSIPEEARLAPLPTFRHAPVVSLACAAARCSQQLRLCSRAQEAERERTRSSGLC